MQIRASKGLRSFPVMIEGVDSVVIEDDSGQPLHLFIKLNDRSILSLSPADKDFLTTLQDLGLHKRCDYEVL